MLRARILLAEAIGTFALVFVGVGVAVTHRVGSDPLDRALAFGLTLAAVTYAIRQISGAHVNPAITVAMWFTRKTEGGLVPAYLVGQFLGAIAAVFLLFVMLQDANFAPNDANPSSLSANTWGSDPSNHWGIGAVVIGEILATALLVLVFLKTTTKKFETASSGIAMGFAYGALHLLLIPVDGGGMHPAKSLATALFAQENALTQVWLFLLLPLIGAILGVLLYLALVDEDLEDTVLRGTIFEDWLDSDDDHDVDPEAADVAALSAGTGATAVAAAAPTVDRAEAEAPAPSAPSDAPAVEAEPQPVAAAAPAPAEAAPGSEPGDDLKRIYGVGKVLEKLLHDEGVTSFKQIANFSADDISHLSAKLGEFSDRIERDHWVEQAARLHLEKYGHSA